LTGLSRLLLIRFIVNKTSHKKISAIVVDISASEKVANNFLGFSDCRCGPGELPFCSDLSAEWPRACIDGTSKARTVPTRQALLTIEKKRIY
jgi:hypothetical protein